MSYRAFEPNAIGSIVPPFSGGMGGSGGAGGPDRFAPKYLVGNVPAGDSATPYSSSGFTYIPDPGDGTGIATALAYANAADPSFVATGDVWIRPGLYDLSLPTSPAAPFTVPAAVTVRGSGGWGMGLGGNYATRIKGRTTGDLRVFLCSGTGSALDGLEVVSAVASGVGATGEALIEVNGDVRLSNLFVTYENNATPAASLVACVTVSTSKATLRAEHCTFLVYPTKAGALGASGLNNVITRGGTSTFTACRFEGGDYGIFIPADAISTTRVLVNASLLQNSRWAGLYAHSVGASFSLVGDTRITLTSIDDVSAAVYAPAGAAPCTMTLRCSINNTSTAGTGVLAATTKSTITGSTIVADTGIDTSAGADTVIVANVITAAPAQYIIPSGTDEVAHNILV